MKSIQFAVVRCLHHSLCRASINCITSGSVRQIGEGFAGPLQRLHHTYSDMMIHRHVNHRQRCYGHDTNTNARFSARRYYRTRVFRTIWLILTILLFGQRFPGIRPPIRWNIEQSLTSSNIPPIQWVQCQLEILVKVEFMCKFTRPTQWTLLFAREIALFWYYHTALLLYVWLRERRNLITLVIESYRSPDISNVISSAFCARVWVPWRRNS